MVPQGPAVSALDDALAQALTDDLAAQAVGRDRSPETRDEGLRVHGRTRHGDVVEATLVLDAIGPIGARVREIRVAGPRVDAVETEAAALPQRLGRLLPEPLKVVEADAERACLRTPPADMRERRFFDLELSRDGRRRLRRYEVSAEGERRSRPWSLTREDLERIVDVLATPSAVSSANAPPFTKSP